jgi:type II secretory ATPase GspE/PulE/Tfp pilus assembly ATPase PilB-like protein
MKPPTNMHAAIVSRVKVIGKMDIAEKRLPQEGRVRIIAEGREIDLRVSSMPTLLGEKLVLRILDKENLRVRMEDLGLRTETLVALKKILEQPHGLVLVTGPTGSGKTTTLYSALDLLRSPEVNIVTVEDPVEYQLDMVNQIQVHESIGFNFARALRSILRQDPDIIMVGEIRDQETARVAIQAALTGHLVLATPAHERCRGRGGAAGGHGDRGVPDFRRPPGGRGAAAGADHLSRVRDQVPPPRPRAVGRRAYQRGRARLPQGRGMPAVHDSGFQGRVGVYELMEVTPVLRRMIHNSAPVHELRQRVRENGGLTLREEGVLLAIAGKTSLEEVLRVTHSEGDEDMAAMVGSRGGAGAAAPQLKEAA